MCFLQKQASARSVGFSFVFWNTSCRLWRQLNFFYGCSAQGDFALWRLLLFDFDLAAEFALERRGLLACRQLGWVGFYAFGDVAEELAEGVHEGGWAAGGHGGANGQTSNSQIVKSIIESRGRGCLVVVAVAVAGGGVDGFLHGGWCQVFVEFFVDEGDWGGVAGAEAFDFDEGEGVVVGGFADFDAEFFAAGVGDFLLAAELAGDGAADGDEVFAFGLEPVFLVEAGGVDHLGGGDFEEGGDLLHGLRRNPAVVVLDDVQRGEQRGERRLVTREHRPRKFVFHGLGEVGFTPPFDLHGCRVFGNPGHAAMVARFGKVKAAEACGSPRAITRTG